jgi:hypothetical protein
MESKAKKQRTTNIMREDDAARCTGQPPTTAPSPVGTRAVGGATTIMTPAAAAAPTDPPTSTTTKTTIKIKRLEKRDWYERWGDGGGAVMSYPVYFTNFDDEAADDGGQRRPAAPSPALARGRLARLLRAVDAQRADVQPNGIVHDIIDPCLHANVLSTADQQQVFDDYITSTAFGDDCGPPSDADEERSEDQVDADKLFNESCRLRSSYQWVPTVVKCHYNVQTRERRAEFGGDIAGMPERCKVTEPLYADLENQLTKMLPLFSKIDLRGRPRLSDWTTHSLSYLPVPHPALDNGLLQVIVKVQEYVLPPRSTYTGRWHTEGFSERITAAGVCYIDVADQCTGGHLEFRPPCSPDDMSDMCPSEEAMGEQTREEYEAEEGRRLKDHEPQQQQQQQQVVSDGATSGPVAKSSQKIDDHGQLESDDAPTKQSNVCSAVAYSSSDDDDSGDSDDNDECLSDPSSPDADSNVDWTHYIREVPVRTGTAIAFQNTIPHRFRTIRNDTDKPQRRLFVNFFVVNPDDPLKVTTSSVAGEHFIRRCLRRKAYLQRQSAAVGSMCNIISHILGYVGGYAHPDRLHRRVLRDQARAAMSRNRGRWHTYMFGNNADLMYQNDCRIRYNGSTRLENYVESGCDTSQLGSGL